MAHKTAFIMYLSLSLAECVVLMLVAWLSAQRFLLGRRVARSRLTSALHMVDDRHHGVNVGGSFVDVLDLQDLVRLVTQVQHKVQPPVCLDISVLCAARLSTCKYLVCVTTGAQRMLLVLQQPEQRCTSTQGGHSMK